MPRCQLSQTKSDLCPPLLLFRSTKQNPFKMKANFLSTSVALVALATSTIAHNIQMGAHSRECFHEQLHKDDKMTVTFQVGDREFGGAGNLEIDFWVRALPPLCRLRFAKCFKRADSDRAQSDRDQITFSLLLAIQPITDPIFSFFRFSIPQAKTSYTSAVFPPATTASTPIKTANLNTASAMNIGRPAAKK